MCMKRTAFVVLEFSEIFSEGECKSPLGTVLKVLFQRDEYESVHLHTQRSAEVCS